MNYKKILLSFSLISFLCGSITYATASKEEITVEFFDFKCYLQDSLLKYPGNNRGLIYKNTVYIPLDLLPVAFNKKVELVKKDDSIVITDKNEDTIIKPVPYSEITGYNTFAKRDIPTEKEPAKILEVLTSAEYHQDKKEWLWDDGQRWIVRVTDGSKDYFLFDQYIQMGTIEIFKATETQISFLVKTHQQFLTIYRCTFKEDKKQFTVSCQDIQV